MFHFIIRRLILLIPVLLVVAVVAFLTTHIMPGDPVIMALGDFAPQEQIDAMRLQLGMDQPFYVQFAIWVQRIFQGDLGQSLFLNMPVTRAIIGRMEPTLLLALIGQSLGILIGVPLGIMAAVRHRTWIDQGSIGISLIGISMPSFWLALLLIMIFSVKLHILPSSGYVPIGRSGVWSDKISDFAGRHAGLHAKRHPCPDDPQFHAGYFEPGLYPNSQSQGAGRENGCACSMHCAMP